MDYLGLPDAVLKKAVRTDIRARHTQAGAAQRKISIAAGAAFCGDIDRGLWAGRCAGIADTRVKKRKPTRLKCLILSEPLKMALEEEQSGRVECPCYS